MAFYETGVRTPAAAAGAAFATLHTGASLRARIRELHIFSTAATAASIGLIRPSNAPVASTSVLGLAQDPAEPASTVNVDTAWSTAPTIGSNFLRRIDFPASIGSGVIWTWPDGQSNGLLVAVSSYLVLWNFGASAGPILDVVLVWEE